MTATTARQSIDKRKLDDTHTALLVLAQTVDGHVKTCDQRAEADVRERRDFRLDIRNQIDEQKSATRAQNDQITTLANAVSNLRVWVLLGALSGMGALLGVSVVIIGWLLVHYAFGGGS